MVPLIEDPPPLKAPQPRLSRVSSLPLENTGNSHSSAVGRNDRTLLTPEDAFHHLSSPPRPALTINRHDLRMTNSTVDVPRRDRGRPGGIGGSRSRSRRRRKGTWKKLLWVKQSYPDNYTDQQTFLEHLQRNPRLQPYDFWPLVADSTVIVQHACSVIIFIVCFVGIFQERISQGAVVGWATALTVLGWVIWDGWVAQDDAPPTRPSSPPIGIIGSSSSTSSQEPSLSAASSTSNLGAMAGPASGSTRHHHSASASSIQSATSQTNQRPNHQAPPLVGHGSAQLSPRNAHRLSTAKSALLIYFTVLGLSPILKSLTRSTSSDSIWAMTFLLFTINIFFFDYSSPYIPSPPNNVSHAVNGQPKLAAPGLTRASASKHTPSSLSTNAAVMASTVLASRLPSTTEVFSLTLFSIEVFGLFPVFRRYARVRTLRGHLILTLLLVMGAGGGVGLIIGSDSHAGIPHVHTSDWPWRSGLVGVIVSILVTGLVMGGCSWWLIGLQKYKNEIHGPWDAARPVIRRQWDDF